MRETQVQSLGQKDPLEKEMATHSLSLAWETPWTDEPGMLQFIRSQRVGHNLVTKQELTCLHLLKGTELIYLLSCFYITPYWEEKQKQRSGHGENNEIVHIKCPEVYRTLV